MVDRFISVAACLLLLSQFLMGCDGKTYQAAASSPGSRQTMPGTSVARSSRPGSLAHAGIVTPSSDLLQGVGIMGDSFYDEYQGSDDRGGQYHAVTFNLVELLAKNRNFNFGAWGSWGEPRREGFEYNWARSGATSTTMIEMGQHTGLARQVAEGKVTFVLVGIGANDFSPYYGDYYQRIYSGTMTDQELQAKIQTAIGSVTLAVDTVQEAGAQGIAITLFTQWDLDPTIQNDYPDPIRRKRVADAIDAVNVGMREMAASRGVALVDQNSLGNTLLPRLDENGFLQVGGESIDFLHHADEPHHSRLADTQHLGTVLSGLVANFYFVDTLNTHFGTNIASLSDQEILANAGIGTASVGRSTYIPLLMRAQQWWDDHSRSSKRQIKSFIRRLLR